MPRLLVGTKRDRAAYGPGQGSGTTPMEPVDVNLHAPADLERVRQSLEGIVRDDGSDTAHEVTGAPFIARARHVEAIANARTSLEAAIVLHEARSFPELVAEELRQAQRALAAVAGSDDTEDLLGAIFGAFCIGK